MEFDTVIGLEIHVQVNTNTKVFCNCKSTFGAAPNTLTCPVCTGQPGALPILNKKVLDKAILAGAALNCKINNYSNLIERIISIQIYQKHIR